MATSPTASVEAPPSGATMTPSDALRLEQEVVEKTELLYQQATEDRDRDREVRETFRIIAYLDGQQWGEKARRARRRPVLNKTRRHFWENVGLLTDLALDFQVKMFNRLNDYCYDSHTEILTRDRGFVLFEDLLPTDYVATRSPSGWFEWQLPTAILDKAYNGPMYRFLSKHIDVVVTPAHRMLVATAKGSKKLAWTEKIISAEQMADGLNNGRKIPQTSSWTGVGIGCLSFPRTKKSGKDFAISGDDFCALLGAYIAEGSMAKNGGIAVSQTRSSKGYVEYKALFDRIGGWYDGKRFVLSLRAVDEYFRQFGEAHEKFVPEIIRNATPRQISIFLHYYALGDGHFRKKVSKSGRGSHPDVRVLYTTVSRLLADQLVELTQKIGRSASVTTKPPYEKDFVINGYTYHSDCRESYLIIERTSKYMGPTSAEKFDYSGRIHCVSVPNGIVYVRRNGNATWCGNSDLERMLNDLLVHWALRNQYEDRQYDVTLYGLLHTGPAKIQWNPTLNGGLGDNQLLPIAPWQWAILGAGTDPQEAECILYFPVVTKDHLIRRFGKVAERVEPDMEYSASSLQGQFQRPARVSKEAWARMSQTLRVSLGIRQSPSSYSVAYPMVLMKEFWLRDQSVNESSRTVVVGPSRDGRPLYNWCYYVEPGEPLYPRGRVIVTAGGVALEDAPNPYWHAKFPFPVFRPFRVPWSLSGQPMMRSWLQMNNIINRNLGGMQDYIDSVNDPTLIAPKGAFPAADWDALDPGAAGGKIKYNNNAPKAPEFAKRSQFPLSEVLECNQMIEKEFDMQSGSSAIQQALGKKQVPGTDSLEMILSSRSLPVRVESRSLASFIEDGGGMLVANTLQFYTVAHRVAVLGAAGISSSDYRPVYGEGIPHGMKPEEYVRRFMGIVRRDTLLQSQKEAKQQIAFTLFKAGILSARNLFRILDVNFDFERNKLELLEEARIKLLVAAAGAALQGKGQAKGQGQRAGGGRSR